MRAKFLAKGNLAERAFSPWLLAAAGAIASANSCRALEPMDLLSYSYGHLTFRPRASVNEVYSDNIYYRENGPNKVGDLLNTFGAGLGVTFGRRPELDAFNILGGSSGRNYLALDYGYSKSMYLSYSDLDGDQHSLATSAHWQANRISLTAQDQYETSASVIGGGINSGNKTERASFNDSFRLNYALMPKTGVYLTGSRMLTDYAQGTPLLDTAAYKGAMGVTWNVRPKIAVFGEAYYALSSVDPNRSTDTNGPSLTSVGGSVGAQGVIGQRLMAIVRLGYETHEFSDRTPVDDTPVASVQFSYKIDDKTRAMLTYSRTVSVSCQLPGQAALYDEFSWRLSRTIGASGRWTTSVGGNFQMGDFGSSGLYAGRQDSWWHANCSVNYLIRLWMMSSLSYEYEDFTSNARAKGIFDYSANRVTIRLSVGY